MLICRAGTARCAVPIRHVEETLRPLACTSLTDAPWYVRGVSVVRGRPTPVVSLPELLGLEAQPTLPRFVTLRVVERRVALLVDAVEGVEWLEAEGSVAPLLRHAGRDVVESLGMLDGDLLMVLNAAQLVSAEGIAQLASETEGT
jgi:purine-binding chemotaxis protein CheW